MEQIQLHKIYDEEARNFEKQRASVTNDFRKQRPRTKAGWCVRARRAPKRFIIMRLSSYSYKGQDSYGIVRG